MRWLPLALCLALAACDSDPCLDASCVTPPPDAGDAGQAPDVSAADVADAPDTGELSPDVVAVADASGADALDVVAVADAVEVAVDAGEDVVDVPVMDVVAVGDASTDVGVDVTRVDVIDVPPADVPRDAGPSDAGGVVYDLEVGRTETNYAVAVRETYAGGLAEDCTAAPTMPSCSVTRGVLAFSIRACGVYLTGSMAVSASMPRTLSIFAGGGGSFATTLRLRAGARIAGSPARQSFHVQAASVPFQGEPGLSGIPGRTVDPALADLWLLGCASD